MNIKKNFIDKYLNSKKNKIIAGCITGAVIIACGGGIVYATRDATPSLKLNKEEFIIEYGDKFNPDFDTLVDTKGMTNEDKIFLQKNIKIKDNLEDEIVTVTNEDGTTTNTKKEYAKVGKYDVKVIYKNETKTVKVIVKDSIAPELTVPENVEILQGSDLATFDFKSLVTATDLAQMNELNIDYSTIDVNTPAEYTVKASIEDINKNKSEKEFKVTIIAPPTVADDEVVVQEEVVNTNGSKSVKNVVKKKADASASGNKVVSGGTLNSGLTGNKPSGSTGGSGSTGSGSTNKPSGGGSSGGSSSGGNSGNTAGSGSGNNGNSSNKPSSGGNTGGSNNTGGSIEISTKYICNDHPNAGEFNSLTELNEAGHKDCLGGWTSYGSLDHIPW